MAHSYFNPEHRESNGNSCEEPCVTDCECDNVFTFCLRLPGSPQNNNSSLCPLGSYRTGKYEDNDNITFDELFIPGSIANPLMFTGEIWPVSKVSILNSLLFKGDVWSKHYP